MRRKIVAGNWKMNGDSAFVAEFIRSLSLKSGPSQGGRSVIIAPPAIYIPELRRALADQDACQSQVTIELAGQNVAAYPGGAFTGEVSAAMLKDFGCEWCLVGHSERRSLFGESDAVVLEKTKLLLNQGIKPILCVGETLEERKSSRAQDVVFVQLDAIFDVLDKAELAKVVVAYEPVWAIGTGETATPEQAQEMHRAIRSRVAEKSAEVAENLTILYGGSVNATNAQQLFGQEDIDGGLVGGASLKADDFSLICEQIG